MQHLLIDCPIVRNIWLATNTLLANMISNCNINDWLSDKFNHNSQRMNVDDLTCYQKVCVALWHICKNRCAVLFDNIHVNVAALSSRIQSYYNDWQNSLIGSNQGRNIVNTSYRDSWDPPTQDYLKLNFDVAFDLLNKKSGLGLIIRDIAGEQHGVGCTPDRAINAEQAEAIAAYKGIQWAKTIGCSNLHIEGDCKNIIAAINGNRDAVKWTSNCIISEILDVLRGSFNN
ncbi:uncharacterized protein LOC113340098 [Papaver somniferum]|uniref:uncharacterized protein LOC113340098 n=1 Tax=Papaver somniferum TaxID=3469 RepID=UPI000E704D95|nr:uncharacterized protein LOC113340098 [Papaver somniferum]